MKEFLIFCGILLFSFVAHEFGHVAVALAAGWKVMRPAGNKLGGLGIAYDTQGRPDRIKAAALGGLFVSAILALTGFALMPGQWAFTLAVANSCLLFVNLQPFGPSDGAYLFGRRRL